MRFMVSFNAYTRELLCLTSPLTSHVLLNGGTTFFFESKPGKMTSIG